MRKNRMGSLLLAMALGLPLIACQDTKARQENDQLKARVAELEKENTDLGGKVDGLAKENSALASENEKLKASQKPAKKAAKGKHRKHKRTSSSSTS
jgi:regulator of replication initiation timing